MGILAEEAAQRLLSILCEAATACLDQLSLLSQQHGSEKYDTLFGVGLDIVNKWDVDIAEEAVTRMEISYPEIGSLHTYICLWMLDKFCTNDMLEAVHIPRLAEVYAIFMKRVTSHRDVKHHPKQFLSSAELFRRSVYVEAFRGAYHDVVHRNIKQQLRYRDSSFESIQKIPREPPVSPAEAASQSGACEVPLTRVERFSEVERSANSVGRLSAFQIAIQQERGETPRECQQAHVFKLTNNMNSELEPDRNMGPVSDFSEIAPSSADNSIHTKAVTLPGTYFFPNCESLH